MNGIVKCKLSCEMTRFFVKSRLIAQVNQAYISTFALNFAQKFCLPISIFQKCFSRAWCMFFLLVVWHFFCLLSPQARLMTTLMIRRLDEKQPAFM